METNLHTQKEIADQIVNWIRDYAQKAGMESLVVGVSGGVDSGLVSTLCAMTGLTTYVVSMPIKQSQDQHFRAYHHMEWLKENFSNIVLVETNLTRAFEIFQMALENTTTANDCAGESFENELSSSNTRSRLRMTALYHIATARKGLVVGTGNKVEDFGVGFYTKYGDGGVDISPIADLMKSEVRELARELGIIDEIVNAVPTDGLWEDGRNDEDQIGASYEELEWAMKYIGRNTMLCNYDLEKLTDRQREVLDIYKSFNEKNSHKMNPIPVFKMNA